MGTGLVIGGRSTGGEVFKLKEGVSIEQAHQKGLKDGLDKVYFKAGNDNYVLQGDGLKLGELTNLPKGNMPKFNITLDGNQVQADIKAIDDEASNVWEGFAKNGKAFAYTVSGGIGIGGTVALTSGITAGIAALSGASKVASVASTIASGGLIAVAAGAVGAVAFSAKSIYDGVAHKPKPENTESLKDLKINTQNNAPEGDNSAKKNILNGAGQAAGEIAIETILDALLN